MAATAIHNNTAYSWDQIVAFPYLGKTINNWRQREVKLYAHPTDPDMLISVGVTFTGSMAVIAEESRSAWRTALDYAEHGKVYTSD